MFPSRGSIWLVLLGVFVLGIYFAYLFIAIAAGVVILISALILAVGYSDRPLLTIAKFMIFVSIGALVVVGIYSTRAITATQADILNSCQKTADKDYKKCITPGIFTNTQPFLGSCDVSWRYQLPKCVEETNASYRPIKAAAEKLGLSLGK